MKTFKVAIQGLLMFAVSLLLGTSVFWWYSEALPYWESESAVGALWLLIFGLWAVFVVLAYLSLSMLENAKEM